MYAVLVTSNRYPYRIMFINKSLLNISGLSKIFLRSAVDNGHVILSHDRSCDIDALILTMIYTMIVDSICLSIAILLNTYTKVIKVDDFAVRFTAMLCW